MWYNMCIYINRILYEYQFSIHKPTPYIKVPSIDILIWYDFTQSPSHRDHPTRPRWSAWGSMISWACVSMCGISNEICWKYYSIHVSILMYFVDISRYRNMPCIHMMVWIKKVLWSLPDTAGDCFCYAPHVSMSTPVALLFPNTLRRNCGIFIASRSLCHDGNVVDRSKEI